MSGGVFGIELSYAAMEAPAGARDAYKREVFSAMARYWHANFRSRHFEESAYSRYGYYKRRGMGQAEGSKGYRRSYTARKRRLFGHNRPLVFTGNTERASRLLDLRVDGGGRRVRVVLPRGLNRTHAKSQIKMRDEVTRITVDEAEELLRIANETSARVLPMVLSGEIKSSGRGSRARDGRGRFLKG